MAVVATLLTLPCACFAVIKAWLRGRSALRPLVRFVLTQPDLPPPLMFDLSRIHRGRRLAEALAAVVESGAGRICVVAIAP